MNIVDINSKEREVFESFCKLWEIQNPRPESKSLFDWRDLGFIFIGKIVTIVSSLILAGLRTAEQFYLAASNSGNIWLGWTEAIFAVLAVEGVILFLSADKAKKRGEIHGWVSNIGILMAVMISLLAGFGQSIRLIDNLDPALLNNFTTATAIALSFASIVAWIGGEILGQELAYINHINRENREQDKLALDEWIVRRLNSYNRSTMRKIVQKEMDNLSQKSGEGNSITLTPYSDWRHVPHNERMKIAQMDVKKIRRDYGLERRTAYAWLENAQKYADEYVYNEDK